VASSSAVKVENRPRRSVEKRFLNREKMSLINDTRKGEREGEEEEGVSPLLNVGRQSGATLDIFSKVRLPLSLSLFLSLSADRGPFQKEL
jgi:hypothetical protein